MFIAYARSRRALLAAGVGLTALSGIAAAPAAAQTEPTAAAGAQIEEVVVTAQRREQRLQDVPVAITAFNAEALADLGVTNLKGITAFTPNVELTTTSRPTAGGSSYAAFIRGVGNGDYAFPTDPAIGLYVDGVYMARPLGGLMSIADIERVEVLRGPQGTLYGRNTLGGAISVVTTAPALRGEPTGNVLLRAGSYGRKDVLAQLTLPLVEDRIGAKVSFATLNSDGWGKQPFTGAHTNDEGRMVFRGGLLFAPTDNLTIDLRADYSLQRQTGATATYVSAYPVLPANIVRFNTFAAAPANAVIGLPASARFGSAFASNDPYVSNSRSHLRDDFDMGGASATINYSPSKAFSFRSISAVRDLKTHIEVDGDNSPYDVSSSNEKFDDQTFSQEFQVSGDLFDSRLHYLAGVYYFKEHGKNFKFSQSFHGVYQVTGLASDARDTFTYQTYDATSYAFFTQEELKLTDTLTLTLGGRLNRDEKDFEVFVTLPERNQAVSVPRQSRNKTWDSFTPRVGLDWKPTNDLMFYGAYSQGFKSGGFGSPTATLAAPVYDPEELTTVELGAKTQWFDRRLTANLAVFRTEWKDIQLSVIVPGPTGGVVNITQNGGEAELYGFEGEFIARPVEGLTLNLGLGYTHHEFTSLTAGARAAGFTLATKLPHIPEWSVNPGIQYDFGTSLGDVSLRLGASYRGDQYLSVNDATTFQKAYTLVNARAAINPAAMPNLELAVEGSNLTDETYLAYSLNATLFGIQLNIPGEPRLINVSAKYKF